MVSWLRVRREPLEKVCMKTGGSAGPDGSVDDAGALGADWQRPPVDFHHGGVMYSYQGQGDALFCTGSPSSQRGKP